MKNKLQIIKKKIIFHLNKKREIKTIKVNELNEFFTDKEFQDFENLVSNKEKLISTKINPESNLNGDFIEKTKYI